MSDLRAFLNYLIKSTNMKCLTADKVFQFLPEDKLNGCNYTVFVGVDGRLWVPGSEPVCEVHFW